jgi:hypothetical protein
MAYHRAAADKLFYRLFHDLDRNNYDRTFLVHQELQKIRDIYAADFRNGTIAAKLKNPRYRLAEGEVIK